MARWPGPKFLNQKLYVMARVVRAVVTTTNTLAPREDLRGGACHSASLFMVIPEHAAKCAFHPRDIEHIEEAHFILVLTKTSGKNLTPGNFSSCYLQNLL
jgi:hypothetical protein